MPPDHRQSPPSALEGLTLEAVEWLPSGSETGLVRVRGRWAHDVPRPGGLPALCARGIAGVERFDSLPDAPAGRDGTVWRGAYLAPAAALRTELWLEWESGERSPLPLPRGLEAELPALPEPEPEPEPGGQVFDRAVLAERRARRAEASEQAQARVAGEALRALEALELRGNELEERAEALTAERDALTELLSAVPREDPQVAEREEHRSRALADALAAAARARMQARQWRLRMRTAEVTRAGDAVRLRVIQAEQAGAEPRRVELDRERGRAEALAERLEAERRRGAELAARLEELRAEATVLEGARRASAAERDQIRARLDEREAALATTNAELAELRAGLVAAREQAQAELAEVRSELAGERERAAASREWAGSLEAALEAERAARAVAGAEAESARAAAATAEAGLRAEAVARAALDDEIDRERSARAALVVALDTGRAGRETLEADLSAARGAAEAIGVELAAECAARSLDASRADEAEAALDAARRALDAERSGLASLHAELGSLRAGLDAERTARVADRAALEELRAELESTRAALARAETVRGEVQRGEAGLLDRITQLDREASGLAGELANQRRAAQQAEASAAAEHPSREQTGRVVADLDAAAAALRATVPSPSDSVPEAPPVEAAPAPVPEVPAATPPRPRRAIVSAPGEPSRAHATGRSQRAYPWLRGALVKLAHDDPKLAGQILAGLLPVQAAVVKGTVDYDLTITEVGTYAVTVSGGRAYVLERQEPRGRREAEFHLSADALTLAELLAGVPHRIGRFRGAVRVTGRRRRMKPLRALAAAQLTLSEAARAGARLEPGLIFRSFPYVIHPAWSRDHRFTVAQAIVGEDGTTETWFVTVGNGAGIKVDSVGPPDGADATVTMTREGFGNLLRGETVPAGHRPSVRGERDAVTQLKAWLDRAQAA